MITIIPIGENDLSFLCEIRNETAPDYLHDSRTFTLEETIKWFKNTKPKFWIIWWNDCRIGYFRTSNYSEINRNIYIGADLHKDFRGRGLAYESYCKFMPILFKELNLHKISLEVLETNTRAINLYKKLGFKIEGIKREEVLKNGVWVGSIIMSILKNEYEKL
jgi:RimJ/RimL family protein N-acetyltransferase